MLRVIHSIFLYNYLKPDGNIIYLKEENIINKSIEDDNIFNKDINHQSILLKKILMGKI